MAILLDIKKQVAAQMGKSDYSTSDDKRNILINSARREFYSAKKWSFCKKSATLTFSSGEASFPTDYNPSHDVGEIYSYSNNTKTKYEQVNLEDLSSYEDDSTAYYVFAIDVENSKILSNQQSATPTLTYFFLPSDAELDTSDDTDTEPAPDISAIALLATAMVWLSKERDEENYDRFYKRYEAVLKRMIERDNKVGKAKQTDNYLQSYDLGYN